MATSVNCGAALYQDGSTLSALTWRQFGSGPAFTDAGTAAALAPLGGVIPGLGANLKVTAGTGLTVNVAAGYAVVPSFTSGDGAYYFGLMQSAVLDVAANSTGSTRQDYVIAYVNDLGTVLSASSVACLTGTAAPPALPASSIVLAQVSVPNSAASIVAGDITDERTFVVAPGGILPLPGASDAPAGPPSQLFWDIATSSLLQATTGAPVAYQPDASVTTVAQQLIVTTHTTGTWTCPPGVYAVRVQAWGAGGSGGDGESGSGPGAGGGGGEYAEEPACAVVPGTSYPYFVPGRPGDQDNGGNTTFNTSGVIAHGGSAGTSAEFTSGGGAGGAGGTGSSNTIHYPGGAGGNPDNGSAAGGSSAGPGSAGNTGADGTDAATAATPAVSGGGPGAAGVASGDVGRAPSSGPGGGGSGSSEYASGQGGAGWQGQLILSWEEPADSPGFAYQPAGTLWLQYQSPPPHALAQVTFTADGLSDWEFSYHAAQVASEDFGTPVQVQLWIDGQQADMIRVDGTSISYPYSAMPAAAVSADATWFTSLSQGTRPSAGTHTAQIRLTSSGNQVAVASPVVAAGRGGRQFVSTFRYVTSSILTGQITGDWLPMLPQNFSRNINAAGTFTGALQLGAGGSDLERRNFIAAMEPEKTVLWIFQDSVPVWCGIIWDWPHMSILDNTLPVSASTMESLFQHRLITDDLEFSSADIFDIFHGLASYALGKTPNGQVAGLTMGSNQAGVTASLSYVATDQKAVYDAWTDLITAYSFEYSIRPAVDSSGGLFMSLDLGYPVLGQPLTAFSPAYTLPGNLLDYRFTRTGSTSSNTVYATASVSGTLSALNATPTFASGTGRWTGANGATVTTSTAWADPGNTTSLQFTGNGTTANPTAVTELIPVTPGQAYTWSADLYSPQGWATVNLNVLWEPSGPFVPIATAIDVAAATAATGNSMSVTAPAGATGAYAEITMAGTPASPVQMMADTCVFSLAAPGSQAWSSQLPHGQDAVVLAAGYPLLEEAVSLSTVNVTSQAQIDAYADGQLAPVTGTQLTPLLMLGADQQPAVKDVTLGSYCYFNATSPLHPAQPGGGWGLQITGRITGWTIYPPTANQTEYSWLALGEITDIDGQVYIPYSGAAGITA